MSSDRREVTTVCGYFNLDETDYKRHIEACKKNRIKKLRE